MSSLKRLLSAVPIAAAFFVIASLTAGLTRFGGGVAFIWVANALLIGRLLTIPRRLWAPHVMMCALASVLATAIFGLGVAAAVPMAAVNVGEAALAAYILRRIKMPDQPMESLRWFAYFVLAAGLIAPIASAVAAAAVVWGIEGCEFIPNAMRWFSGHSLGALTFTPIFMFLLRFDSRTLAKGRSAGRIAECCCLLLLVAATSVVVFAQREFPLLFLPLLPIILATFRSGRFAAAVSIAILALVGGAFTLLQRGPVVLIGGTLGDQMQFLQFYLAATVLTVLPIAADLARRGVLFRRLRDSEARYRLLADNSTDIILNLDADGCIRFVSPSITQLGGYVPADLLGTNATDLIHEDHRSEVQRAHVDALRGEGATMCVEYRAMTGAGELRWFETRSRCIQDGAGRVDGVVSVIRDIEERKMIEGRLSAQARMDALTGLLNRRAFDDHLRAVTSGAPDGEVLGCVALFDVDFFKRVNDTYGHAAGDRVLQAFAAVTLESVRGNDVVARIGGEEFALMLVGATVEQATAICERLRAATAVLAVEDAGRTIHITVSGGVAQLVSGREREVLRDADTALYAAKSDGRNRFAWAA